MASSDDLEPVDFDALGEAFAKDDLGDAFRVFRRSAEIIAAGAPALRPGVDPGVDLQRVSRLALEQSPEISSEAARAFFTRFFRPFSLPGLGFVTAYYEVVVDASPVPQGEFRTAVTARPADLVTLNDSPIFGEAGEPLTSARRLPGGSLVPYPDRAALEDGPEADRLTPIAYVRDRVELFLMQVQGSARLRFPGGRELPLTYDGRNGRPYTSIGRLMIERGLVAREAMSLETLKTTIRAMGQQKGEPGARLLQENRSYVFFRADDSPDRMIGPIGAQGAPLTPLRTIAVDRSLWAYGLPFFLSATLPWRDEQETAFARLMIAQDTGSAILGRARADLFFGSGVLAGDLAGRVRHPADFIVLLPRREEELE